jgi:predicted RNA-binding Zn-ribbon protein involved in translation (DUF1610 family)
MSPEYVNCNQCGARLEVAPTTNFVTCSQCGHALAVKRTATSLFTELAGIAPAVPRQVSQNTPDVQEQLSELRRDTELNRLDREWDRQREELMVRGRYGNRYQPTPTASIFTGIVAVVGGLIWMVFAFSIVNMDGPGGFFPFFGIVFILFGVGVSIYTYSKAMQYQQAENSYKRRRAKLLGEEAEKLFPERSEPRAEEPADEPESTDCLSCGANIPAFHKACPKCGWSYDRP